MQKGENMTIVENWGIMHQHQGGLGTWINEEAEAIGVSVTCYDFSAFK